MHSDQRPKEPRLDVREIVLIALLSAVGGVLSTYIGYLGNLINRFFGVPFGAGQLVAGLHVLWPLLARFLIGRFGSGTLTGVTKGLVEFLSGGTHGVVIVFISFVEGFLVDVGMGISRRPSLLLAVLTGAIASASNVFLFQAIYFSGVSLWFILFMAGLSFVSGAFFGGYLSWDLHRFLIRSRIVRSPHDVGMPKAASWKRHLITLGVVGALLAGGVYYYVEVTEPFVVPGAAKIEGAVSAPYVFRYSEWSDRAVIVRAELRGSVSYVPPQNYAGVPLFAVLEAARPNADAITVRVVADDGYEARFDFQAVLEDAEMILALDSNRLRLVAANYDGSYWVRRVTRVVVQ
jgi:ABC-type thiamin/hydroxymethylpyrimidine transport system permease subunit